MPHRSQSAPGCGDQPDTNNGTWVEAEKTPGCLWLISQSVKSESPGDKQPTHESPSGFVVPPQQNKNREDHQENYKVAAGSLENKRFHFCTSPFCRALDRKSA